MADSTRQIVEKIRRELEHRGVKVEIHESVSTSSFYLTFDNGVLKQARVGDHKGKGYKYTYEIGPHIKTYSAKEFFYKKAKFKVYRYPAAEVLDLVRQVVSLRANLRARYGREEYSVYVANFSDLRQYA